MTLADAASAPPRHYLLRGLIAPGELSLWWGPPKCGKSFLLLRLAYGLALGAGMWGRKAKPCRVLYVAAEGEGGFRRRERENDTLRTAAVVDVCIDCRVFMLET